MKFPRLGIHSTLTPNVDAEGDEGVEDLEDDGGLDHAVVVQLPQVVHHAHAPLVVLGVVDLGYAGYGGMRGGENTRHSCQPHILGNHYKS